MQNASGEWEISPKWKLEIFAEYYTQLHNSENPSVEVIEDFFLHLDVSGISPDQFKVLNAPVFLKKVMVVIDALKVGKAPGPDGFILEFYKIFKFSLHHRLHKVFVSAFEARKVPAS